MLCRSCGKQVSDGFRFCTECGAPLDGAPAEGYAVPQSVQPAASLGAAPAAPAPQQTFQPPVQQSAQIVDQPRKPLPTAAIVGIIAAIAVIAIAVIVAVALFAPIGNSGTETGSTEQSTEQQQAEPEEATLQAPEEAAVSEASEAPAFTGFTTVSASSTLPTEGINYESYAAANLLDGNPATCWSEGASGQGQGESVQFSANGLQTISGFDIWNGFQESDYLYDRNGRPAALNVFADGTFVQTINLADSGLGSQRITFAEPVQATAITLEIVSVYGGSAHSDCCISEVAFF